MLSNPRDLHKFFLVAEKFSQGEIPRTIVQIIKLGRTTVSRKQDGPRNSCGRGDSEVDREDNGTIGGAVPIRFIHSCRV